MINITPQSKSINPETDIPTVEMEGIYKHFPGVTALNCVDFTLKTGEIHALLGENGAGKSTLMNILSGRYHADEGIIKIRGKEASINSPSDAIGLQIGMVYQNFMLIPELSVAENIVLGDEKLPLRLNKQLLISRVKDLVERYGLLVDPKALVWQLSLGEQQRVEIVKMFYRQARVLILDEPTTVLTPQEAEKLFQVMRENARRGYSFIFISHKLDEVLQISDRITVLRKGKNVGTVETKLTSHRELARMMVGRDVVLQIDKPPFHPGRPVLQVRGLEAKNDKGLPALKKIGFEVHQGEIFGIAGVAGNGQRELAQVITGLREKTSGLITINGREMTKADPERVIQERVAHIPEKTIGVGLVPEFGVASNLVLKEYRTKQFCRAGILNRKAIDDNARKIINRFQIMTPNPETPVKLLSGGNAQKVVVGREMSSSPTLIIAVYPTRGLDVGAVEFVYRTLEEEKKRGAAILLIGEELEELITLSDRIGVMYNGELVGVVEGREVDIEKLGLLMTRGRE